VAVCLLSIFRSPLRFSYQGLTPKKRALEYAADWNGRGSHVGRLIFPRP
jgi:hypothetical protein